MTTRMIRQATTGDVAAVAALEQEIFGVDAWSRVQVAEELTGERRKSWIAGEVAGYAVVLETGDVTDLQRIVVDPGQRRRGIAHALLDTAVAASAGDRMLLEVSATNAGAIAFYAAAGFVQIDRRSRYYRDGSDAIVMRLPLKEGCSWNH